jgi:2-polyprenyl-6-methoxyphenol hydroxylase-like FAD-dependent oxidoreductase
MSKNNRVLISGAGIAGLTLATLLKQQGYEPLVVERNKALRSEATLACYLSRQSGRGRGSAASSTD